MDGPLSFKAPELLRQRGWMQALARSILRAPEDADDATQDALLAALERPPQAGRPAGPWLARVVTNFAYRLRRGEGRRRAREQAVRAEHAPPDPVELFAIQQDVARAVQRLDEPLRATIVLHYFGGLDAGEIARRQGVPPATVRQRLHRGRERLREDLERHYGSSSAFGLALARLAQGDDGAGVGSMPTPASAGVVLKLVALGAAALALGVSWMLWSTASRTGREGLAGDVASASSSSAGERRPPDDEPALSSTDDPRRAEQRAGVPAPGQPTSVQQIVRGFRVAGEAVDGDGRALSDAEVLLSAPHPGWDAFEVAARTDAAGRFRLESVDDRRTIVARAAGLAPSIGVWIHALPGSEVPLRIVLGERGTTVRGRVSDEAGRPLAEARVCVGRDGRAKMFLDPDEGRRPPPALTRTDAGGESRLEHVPAGAQPVFVQAPGCAPWSGALDVASDGDDRLEVRLAPGARLHGRVLDPSGAPVAGASILGAQGEPGPFQPRTRTDEHGAFALDGLAPGPARFVAADDRFGRAEAELELAAGKSSARDLVLDPRARIHGTLRDHDGEPLSGWEVRSQRGDEEEGEGDLRTTDEHGAFAFAVEPGSTWRVAAFAPGVVEGLPALVVRDVQPSVEPLALVRPDLAATTGRVIGRLRSADGAGTGAAVAVASVWPDDLWCAVPLDPEGRFEIAPVPPGTIEVQVQSQRFGRVRLGEHALEARAVLDLGTLVLAEPGRVHGMLHGLSERMGRLRVDLRRLDADVGTLEGSVSGASYRAGELQPGDYELTLQGDFVASIQRALTIQGGLDLALDLELRPAGRRTLVLGLPEPGPSPWVWCHVRDASGASRWSGSGSAAGGELELRVSAEPGLYRVEAASEDGDELAGELEITGLDGAQAPLVLEFPRR